jgi:hypothetical protein
MLAELIVVAAGVKEKFRQPSNNCSPSQSSAILEEEYV